MNAQHSRQKQQAREQIAQMQIGCLAFVMGAIIFVMLAMAVR